ncbi:hypothetical protein KIPB_007615, partial [Kipferlia bialata]
KWQSVQSAPMQHRQAMRQMRMMTRIVCFEGTVSMLGASQVEVPGLWTGLDEYDILANRRVDGKKSARTTFTSASRQSRASGVNRVERIARQPSYTNSVASSAYHQSESGYTAYSTAKSTARGGQAMSRKLSQALDKAGQDMPRVAVLVPDDKMLLDTAIEESGQGLVATVRTLAMCYAQADDMNRCTIRGFFGPMESTPLMALAQDLIDLRVHLAMAGGGQSESSVSEAEAQEMEDQSYEVLDICQLILTNGPMAEVEAFIKTQPVHRWSITPADITGLGYLAMKAVLGSFRVLHSDQHNVPLHSVYLRLSLTPPISDGQVLQVDGHTLRCCLNHSSDTIVQASVLLQPPKVTLYIVAASDWFGEKGMSRDDSVASLGLGNMHVSLNVPASPSALTAEGLQRVDSFGGDSSPTAARKFNLTSPVGGGGPLSTVSQCLLPVYLGTDLLGVVRLKTHLHRDFWGSLGAQIKVSTGDMYV